MTRKMFKWKVSIPAQTVEVYAMYPYTARDKAVRLAEGVKVDQVREEQG